MTAPDIVSRSKALMAAGRAGEARSLLEAELQGGSGNPAVHALLGYALHGENRLEEAEQVLGKAVRLFPGDSTLHQALARMRWMNGAGDRFIDDFLAAVKAHPSDTVLRLKCVELLRHAGMTGPAERLLRDGLSASPGDIDVQAWLAILLDETDRLEESASIIRPILRAYPHETDLRLSLSHTLMRMGRPDEALQEIAAVRRADPSQQLAITYEATALRQKNDPRYRWLCGDQYVREFYVAPPPGYADIATFNRALGQSLRELHTKSHHPLEQSLRGGSQISQNLLASDDPVIRDYLAALHAPIQAYIDGLGDDPGHPLEQRKSSSHAFSGCWSVLLRPGGFHVNHTHPLGWISSSYYVSLPAQMSVTDSQEGWIKFGEPRWPIPGCGVEKVVQPREGLLVLFPSYMWHGTIPFSSGERLTAPFDVVPAVAGAK